MKKLRRKLLLGAIVIPLLAGMVGCGDGSEEVLQVVYREVTPDVLKDMKAQGFVTWERDDQDRLVCVVNMGPRDWYAGQDKYHYVLGHEFDHCIRGSYHAPDSSRDNTGAFKDSLQ